MTENAAPSRGKFVWHDCVSTDPARAEEFYTGLLGWRVVPVEMGPAFGTYRMIFSGEDSIGGFVTLDPAQGVPSHWLGYCTVEDVDGACRHAERNGGAVAVPGTDIPNVGRFAVLRDPQGAYLCPFRGGGEPQSEVPADAAAPVGQFCWDQLMTPDPAAAREYYGPLFGWTFQTRDMGPMGEYTFAMRGDRCSVGILPMPPEAGAPPHWLAYVAVDDVDAAAARCGELDGRVWKEPGDIPSVGRFAVLADPTGAVFAVYKGA
jgi:predicted enzyme related to lactoylglutathione lyase